MEIGGFGRFEEIGEIELYTGYLSPNLDKSPYRYAAGG